MEVKYNIRIYLNQTAQWLGLIGGSTGKSRRICKLKAFLYVTCYLLLFSLKMLKLCPKLRQRFSALIKTKFRAKILIFILWSINWWGRLFFGFKIWRIVEIIVPRFFKLLVFELFLGISPKYTTFQAAAFSNFRIFGSTRHHLARLTRQSLFLTSDTLVIPSVYFRFKAIENKFKQVQRTFIAIYRVYSSL